MNISRVIKGAAAIPPLLVALVIILMLAERKVISLISSAVKNDLVKLTLKVVCTKLLFFSTGVKGIPESLFHNYELNTRTLDFL